MRTAAVKVYSFDELNTDIQKKVISNLSGPTIDESWYEFMFEDAKTIGLKITEFDLDRNRHAKGEFINTAEDVAEAIIENHGIDSGTRKEAQTFLDEFRSLDAELSAAQRGEPDEDNIATIEGKIEDLQSEFKDQLLEEYALLLQKEYDYQYSDEASIERIKSNEYEFTADGEIFHQPTPKTTDHTRKQINGIIESANREIEILKDQPNYYGSESQIEEQNALFEHVKELDIMDYEKEPHHSWLLKATAEEMMQYLIRQCRHYLMPTVDNDPVMIADRVFETSMIAGIIVENCFEEFYPKCQGFMNCHYRIAEISVMFYDQHTHVKEWEEYSESIGLNDWEECVLFFARAEMMKQS